MTPTYKKVKVSLPHCPECGEKLCGNNSLNRPWMCRCGVWKGNWINPGEYEIVKEK